MEKVNKPKIGIMTFYAAHNNGAALQAFALQRNLQILGSDVDLIRFYDRHNEKELQRHSRLYNLFHNPNVLKNVLFHFRRAIKLRGKSILTDNEYKSFKQEYFCTSIEPYYEYDDLYKANTRYNGFVAGSDMVWTPIGQCLPAYFLQFADKGKRFSYSPSMTGMHTYTQEQHDEIQKYLKDLDVISCREKEGVDYVMKNLSLAATQTLDPTLLFKKEEWCKELGIKIDKGNKPYILCYLFDELSKVHKKSIFDFAKSTHMEVRFIPMSGSQTEYEIDNGHIQGYGPKSFVEMFLNASFIITNTYHGLMFSLISENPFVLVHRGEGNQWKSNEGRMSYILEMIGEQDRYLYANQPIPMHMFECDYSNINAKINQEREKSLAYLANIVEKAKQNQLSSSKATYLNVQQVSIKECTGCGVCSHECSLGAITMIANEEGFAVPKVNFEKCANCGKCVKKCPSINPIQQSFPISAKGCLSRDKLLSGSASGGVFVTLARYVINELKGVVYGAVFDKDFNVIHTEGACIDDVQKMQNSKYVQSNIVDILPKIKNRLKEGRFVLFSGTPCQVSGVLVYVGEKLRSRLITVELICHGVPSPGFWKQYLRESFGERVLHFSFRNRTYRYEGRTSFMGGVYLESQKKKSFSHPLRMFTTALSYVGYHSVSLATIVNMREKKGLEILL